MSRTWHHSTYRKKEYNRGTHWINPITGEIMWEEGTPVRTYYHRGKQREVREDHWPFNEPKWWRRYYKHKKRRAEWSRCYSKIRKGYDLDNMVYPLDKRPWEYYW